MLPTTQIMMNKLADAVIGMAKAFAKTEAMFGFAKCADTVSLLRH